MYHAFSLRDSGIAAFMDLKSSLVSDIAALEFAH